KKKRTREQAGAGLLICLALGLAATAWAAAPPAEDARTVTLRYVRPRKDKFVLESLVTEVTNRQGVKYVSVTDRGSEKMTLTIRRDGRGRVRDAEAVRETTKGKQTVTVAFDDKGAVLTRKDSTERLKVAADVVVTTAPGWSDVFS